MDKKKCVVRHVYKSRGAKSSQSSILTRQATKYTMKKHDYTRYEHDSWKTIACLNFACKNMTVQGISNNEQLCQYCSLFHDLKRGVNLTCKPITSYEGVGVRWWMHHTRNDNSKLNKHTGIAAIFELEIKPIPTIGRGLASGNSHCIISILSIPLSLRTIFFPYYPSLVILRVEFLLTCCIFSVHLWRGLQLKAQIL